MCGIVGFYSKKAPTKAQWDYLNDALFIDTVRGHCGTGIAAVNNADASKYAIIKKAVPGPDFLQLPVWDSFEREYNKYNIFLGHNRASTRGEASDKNAHPFYAGKGIIAPNAENHYTQEIILVHNGTLNDFHRLSPKGFIHEVDSAHIASGMAWKGEQETLESLNGWFVLLWVNLTKKTFNLARSDCRDISLITSKDGETLYFGSEALLINPCLSRNKIDTDDTFKSPGSYEWFTWPMDEPNFKNYTRQAIKKWSPIIEIGKNTDGRISRRDRRNQDHWSPLGGGYHENWQGNARPFQNERDTDTEDLKELHLIKDEDVEFMVTKWECFSASHQPDMGKMFGETLDGHQTPVVIYSIRKEDYDNFYSKDIIVYEMVGKAKRVDWLNKERHAVLNLNVGEIKHRALRNQVKMEQAKEDGAGPLKATIAQILDRESHEEQTAERAVVVLAGFPEVKLPGPRGDLLGLQEWRTLVQDGCQQCGCNITPEEANHVWWIGEYCRDPICADCAEQRARSERANKSNPLVLSHTPNPLLSIPAPAPISAEALDDIARKVVL